MDGVSVAFDAPSRRFFRLLGLSAGFLRRPASSSIGPPNLFPNPPSEISIQTVLNDRRSSLPDRLPGDLNEKMHLLAQSLFSPGRKNLSALRNPFSI